MNSGTIFNQPFSLSKFSEGGMSYNAIVLYSVAVVGIAMGVVVLVSYFTYLVRKPQERRHHY
jgi:hypothetical protein